MRIRQQIEEVKRIPAQIRFALFLAGAALILAMVAMAFSLDRNSNAN